MKLKIKTTKKRIRYIVDIYDDDVRSVKWPKEELEILKRKNKSDKISDIIYGVQVQARNIEKNVNYSAKTKKWWEKKNG